MLAQDYVWVVIRKPLVQYGNARQVTSDVLVGCEGRTSVGGGWTSSPVLIEEHTGQAPGGGGEGRGRGYHKGNHLQHTCKQTDLSSIRIL